MRSEMNIRKTGVSLDLPATSSIQFQAQPPDISQQIRHRQRNTVKHDILYRGANGCDRHKRLAVSLTIFAMGYRGCSRAGCQLE